MINYLMIQWTQGNYLKKPEKHPVLWVLSTVAQDSKIV